MMRSSVLLSLTKRLFVLAFVFSPSAHMQANNAKVYAQEPLVANQAFIFSYRSQGNSEYILHWQIAQNYYLYKSRFAFEPTEPTALTASFIGNEQVYSDQFFGEMAIYKDQVEVIVRTDKPQENLLELKVSYQGCWEGGICYPVETVSVLLPPDGIGTTFPSLPKNTVLQSPAITKKGILDNYNTPQEEREPRTANPAFTDLISNDANQNFFINLFSQNNVFFTLLVFYVAGIALAFTPCVFVAVPILSAIISKSAANITPLRGFLMTLAFVLGSAVTYTILGIIIGVLGENLQLLLQQDWVFLATSALFVALAASMFGIYRMQLPLAWQNMLYKLSDRQDTSKWYGLVAMGSLSALVIGPCLTAPLAGIFLYLGSQGDPVLGGASLFVLGLGMGTPLLIAGSFAATILPKAGTWLKHVQHFFGFVMLLFAVWMLERVLEDSFMLLLYGIVLVFFGCYMWQIGRTMRPSFAFTRGVALLSIVCGLLQIIGYSSGGSDVYQPLKNLTSPSARSTERAIKVTSILQLNEQIQLASAVGRPLLVKFNADWCVSCEVIEQEVFADSDFQQRAASAVIISADISDVNETTMALLRKYNLLGPPAVLFFAPDGTYRENLQLVGNVTKEQVLKNLALTS